MISVVSLFIFHAFLESLCPKLLNRNGRSREVMIPPFCHLNHFQLCEKKPPVHTRLWILQAGEPALPVRIVIGHLM